MSSPNVARLRLFPIKGLDALEQTDVTVLASGALAFDRRWAFVDSRGRFVNGKNRAEVHGIRAQYDLPRGEATLDGRTFSLQRQKADLEAWMSDRLNEPVALREDVATGFPDDTASPGPTLVSTASIAAVAGWFERSVDEIRARFRCNIEIDGTAPFWEDALYGASLRAGPVVIDVVNPCARCVVPSRHPFTGEALPGFQKQFMQARRQALPSNANAALFDHYYRFTANTRIAPSQSGRTIRIGDAVADTRF